LFFLRIDSRFQYNRVPFSKATCLCVIGRKLLSLSRVVQLCLMPLCEKRSETVLSPAFFAYNCHVTRRRHQKEQHAHYYLLVNAKAANHNRKLVDKLAEAIRRKGRFYTVYQSDSAADLVHRVRLACGLKRTIRPAPDYIQRRGKVTALVACGGDGTFNLVAEVALAANLPMGALPMGRYNNIVRSLYDSVDAQTAINKILNRDYRKIDTATASGRLFVGSLGVGLIPELAHLLQERKTPRFAFRWSQLGGKAASAVRVKKMTIAVDSFLFKAHPTIFNINLLPYSLGLPLNPASILDDHQAETIFNVGSNGKEMSSFVRLICKRKYFYGCDVRLYRGKAITAQPIKGQTLYLDGELIDPPSTILKVQVGEKQLKVYC
jgi:diacylglycerol kinase (ATP)